MLLRRSQFGSLALKSCRVIIVWNFAHHGVILLLSVIVLRVCESLDLICNIFSIYNIVVVLGQISLSKLRIKRPISDANLILVRECSWVAFRSVFVYWAHLGDPAALTMSKIRPLRLIFLLHESFRFKFHIRLKYRIRRLIPNMSVILIIGWIRATRLSDLSSHRSIINIEW